MAGEREEGPMQRLHDVQDIKGVAVHGDGLGIQWSVENMKSWTEVRMSIPEAHKLLGLLNQALKDENLGQD